jgi:tetratricopeptide (TPR) repeat protein
LAFLQNDKVAVQEEVNWATGRPGAEDVFNSQADTEAFYGRFRGARRFSRQAIESTQRAGEEAAAAEYMGSQAWREAAIGNIAGARSTAKGALALRAGNRKFVVNFFALLASAEAGDSVQAGKLADQLSQWYPQGTLVQHYWVPTMRAAIEVQRNNPLKAAEILQTVAPYEMSPLANLFPIYVRGQAHLKAGQGREAAAEFQKVLDNPGVALNSVYGALAHLQLARAQAMMGDKQAARKSYQNFLTLWKDADPDIPIYKQAKAEYAKLR